METPHFSAIAPGVWRAVVGQADEFTPLGLMKAEPRIAAMGELPAAGFPLDEAAITGEVDGGRTVVVLPLEPDEHVFGLGLQFLKVNHRGRTRYLRVNSDPVQDTGETHAPVPFYVSSRGYGVLVNTARIVTMYCASCGRKAPRHAPHIQNRVTDPDWAATPLTDTVEIVAHTEGLEILVFAGDTPLDVVRRYNLFCGGGTLPPRWGLGFWHRVPLKFTAEEALAEAMDFRKRDFPCDVI